MRIVYMGDGPWSHNALELILKNDSMEVLEVVGRASSEDHILEKLATEAGIPFRRVKKVNAPEYIEHFKSMAPDVLVSMSYDQIYKEEILSIPKKLSINCHAGALPFYRGRNILNWAIINGETEFGITVHEIVPGVDEGDIIVQEKYPIRPEDDYGSILKVACSECASLLYKALVGIEADDFVRIKQSDIDPEGSYCRKRKPGDEWIDWNWSAEQVFNFVRGIAPPAPGARFILDGNEYAILKSKPKQNYDLRDSLPGEVVTAGKTATVNAGGSALNLLDVREAKGLEVAAENIVDRFQAGDRFKKGDEQ